MNRPTLFVLLAALLALPAAAVAQGTVHLPPTDDAAAWSAMQTFDKCVGEEVAGFDDHISDAATIARAAVSLCHTDWEFYESAHSAGRFSAAPPGDPQEVALLRVLLERVRRNDAHSTGHRAK